MAKQAAAFCCSSCATPALKWAGRCSRCGEFGTVVETRERVRPPGQSASLLGRQPAVPARSVRDVIRAGPSARSSTGIGEFDRVLGGGLVPGQVVLLSGPPGSGKSTLLLAVADSVARAAGKRVLYVSGEESTEQIAVRADRIGADAPDLLMADETDLAVLIGHIEAHSPDLALVIVDSVQTIASAEVEGRAGGVTQVMAVAQALTRLAKARSLPVVLVGQVTKDSTVAGPRALEHIVDTTLSLDGDKHTSLRLLRAVKNRFGSLEVAAFEQTDRGMSQVPDPSALFRGERSAPVPGTCVTVTVEGQRAVLAEVQALVAERPSPNPRRGIAGLDSARSAMLVAVTERATKLPLGDRDVYLATVGGIRLTDPAADLAVCLAVLTAGCAALVPMDTIAFGEVTLSGDIRPVPMITERIAEAARLGYRRVLAPPGSRARSAGRAGAAEVVEVANIGRAAAILDRTWLEEAVAGRHRGRPAPAPAPAIRS